MLLFLTIKIITLHPVVMWYFHVNMNDIILLITLHIPKLHLLHVFWLV